MKNFSMKLEELKNSVGVESQKIPQEGNENFSEDQGIDTQVTDEQSARALGEALAKKMWGDQYDQKIFDGVFATALEQCGENWDHVAAYLRKVYQGANEMKNFSERLKVLQESVGIVPEPAKPDVQTPAESQVPEVVQPPEVTETQEGKSTPAVVEPANLSETPAVVEKKDPKTPTTPSETTCPECGKKIIVEFSNLTDEEFNEIVKEAKEYSKYPEQYETEGDRIQAFSDWLQNSRLNEFCKEAIYKAFCNIK